MRNLTSTLMKLGFLLNKNPKFQTIFKFTKLDVKGIRLFSLVVPIFGILVFFMDLMFALALQRFLSSVGLINGVTNTRIFGDNVYMVGIEGRECCIERKRVAI